MSSCGKSGGERGGRKGERRRWEKEELIRAGYVYTNVMIHYNHVAIYRVPNQYWILEISQWMN